MPAISMQDLENAKTDVDHIAAVATSLEPTATDRLGHVKQTLAGAVGSIAAITDRGAWVTGTAYQIKDVVTVAGIVYICVSGHTAGATFAGDSAKWRVYQGVTFADLANDTDPSKGAGLLGYKGRTQAAKNAERVSIVDYANLVTDGDWAPAFEAAVADGPVYCPPGVYPIGRPIVLPKGAVLYAHKPEIYPNFSSDWQTWSPSFAGECAIIQNKDGVHGALLSTAGAISLWGLVFRVGQARTSEDCLFAHNAAPSELNIANCLFQNLNHLASQTNGAYGGWLFTGNTVSGVNKVLYGGAVDMRFSNNTVTSTTEVAVDMQAGSGYNIFSNNRFEWGVGAYKAYDTRSDVIIGNIFDAHEGPAVQINTCNNLSVVGNKFARNGRAATAGKRSHISVFANSNNNHIHDNEFVATTSDDGSAGPWPQYIIELESVTGVTYYEGNNDANGYTIAPVIDTHGTSPGTLKADRFYIPEGFGNPNTSSDTLHSIISALNGPLIEVADLYLHDNRMVNGYVVASKLSIRGMKSSAVSITNGAGNLTLLAGLHNINYGGVTYTLIGGIQYASAQPNGFGNSGGWPVGKAVFNSAPSAGGYIGWVKTASGSPDTWKTFGAISS